LVNVCTHPVLWWMLAHPTLQQTLMAEAVVAEAALQAVAVRRDVAVLAQLSLAANTSSLFVGPLLN
jgi:hypothetical protein